MPTPPSGSTAEPGTYALWFRIDDAAEIAVGRRYRLRLEPGWVVYVGSAFGPGGTAARLAHHRRPVLRPHWHIDYLRAHIEAVEQAVEDGCSILSYCVWSFTDLLSWLNGYQKRYGLVYVDRDEAEDGSLKRYRKDSYFWYQKVIESAGRVL